MHGLTLGFLLPLATAHQLETSVARQGDVAIHLSCELTTVAIGEPLTCRVLLETKAEAPFYLMPRTVTPFRLPNRPPALLRFYRLGDGQEVELQLTSEAERGRYDLPSLIAFELQLLRPRQIVGWVVNLNGGDWTLPKEAQQLRIVADLEITYPGNNPLDSLNSAAASNLLHCFSPYSAEDLIPHVLQGKWRSAAIEVSLVPRGPGE